MSHDDRRHRPPLLKWYVWVFGALVLISLLFFLMLLAGDSGADAPGVAGAMAVAARQGAPCG